MKKARFTIEGRDFLRNQTTLEEINDTWDVDREYTDFKGNKRIDISKGNRSLANLNRSFLKIKDE